MGDQSFVISVSLKSGCYRHIQISGEATLEDLSSFILEAFKFDNDHLHAFFMDNKIHSPDNCYYSKGSEEKTTNTSQIKLNQLELTKGKKFKYLFDFGESWEFQCNILSVLNEKTDAPKIVKTKGEAPSQYGGFEEEDEDEEEEKEKDQKNPKK